MNLDQLSPRERQLLIGLASVAAILVVLIVPIRVSMWLSSHRQQNEELRHAIAEVDGARVRVAQQRAVLGDVAARYAFHAPQLRILISDAAKAAGVDIVTQNDIAAVPRGKLYSERGMRLSIQKTGLKALVRFMEAIERSGHPVAFTAFDMSKRVEPDAYTVNLTISAFDRAASPAAAASVADSKGERR